MTKRTDDCEQLVAIIAKFKLNKGYLAEKIGVEVGNFSRKYANKENSQSKLCQFTPSQKEKLTEVIQNIGVELIKIDKI
jgi:hypothetical protein